MRVGAHPPRALRRERLQVAGQAARWRRTAPRAGSCASTARAGRGARVAAGLGQRDLVGAEGSLDREAVDLFRPGPALRGAQHDHRPRRAGRGRPRRGVPGRGFAGIALDGRDVVQHLIERGRELLVDGRGLVAGDEVRLVAVAAHQRGELVVGDAGQHGRVGDLVAVEVQHRQHRAVGHRVEELVRVPAGRQRAGLCFPVAHHAQHQQIRVVERGAVGVHQGVAELAALVDGAGRLRRDMAGDAAGEGELPEQRPQPVLVLADRGVHLAVGAFQVGVGDQPRAAVARAGHVQRAEVTFADDPVHVRVQQVQPGRRPPVPEQPRLDVLGQQGLAQQRVVQQVDLPDGQVVRGAPVRVDQLQVLLAVGRGWRRTGVLHGVAP